MLRRKAVLLLMPMVAALLLASGVAWAASVAFAPTQNYEAGDLPLHVTSADFNGDSERDLAVANLGSDNVSVLLGNGNGTFGSAQNYAAGDGPQGIVSADFNKDGHEDLAVTNDPPELVFPDKVSVLLGNGDGTFGPPQSFLALDGPDHLTSADYNGDGNADLATSNGGSAHEDPNDPTGFSYSVSVLFGNGDGTFQETQNVPTGDCPQGIVSADFNEDGHSDLVTANDCDATQGVYVLLNNGDGSFGAAERFPLVGAPNGIVNADFNDDGNEDVAVANQFSDPGGTGINSGVFVLLGNGDGTFQESQGFGAGDRSVYLTSADFDGDTKADLAVTNLQSGNVSVLLGNGVGSFGSAQDFGVGDSPIGITSENFNADTEPDLAVANLGSGNVSVLLNVEPPPDTTPPTVSDPNPPDRATGVNTSTVTATIADNPDGTGVDPNSVNNGTFKLEQLKATGNVEVPGKARCDSSSNKATFTVDPSFLKNGSLPTGVYQVTITRGVQDNAGNALAEDYTWRFTTAGPKPKK